MRGRNYRKWPIKGKLRMKSFKTFIEEKSLARKYVAVVYDEETQKNLRKWCKENGFDLTKSYDDLDQSPEDFEFHTTVFYSTNELNIKNEVIDFDGEVEAKEFKLLGENHDIPVLVVLSDDLSILRKTFKQMGLEDKWPNYIPHISLSYVKKDYDLNTLKLPDFKMKFRKLKIENIEEEL
jgi:2'-5' RNA ligase